MNPIEVLKSETQNLERFEELYAVDRYKARIFAIANEVTQSEVVLNRQSETVFQIFENRYKYQVTSTLKKYRSKKCFSKVFVNKDRFWYSNGRNLIPLCLVNVGSIALEIIKNQCSWVRFLQETDLKDVPFNTITRYKLYSRDKCLRHLYKLPAAKAMIVKNHIERSTWRQYIKNIVNLENLNMEIFATNKNVYDHKVGLFTDAMNMAYRLNKKVNAAWSIRRLTEEHDLWSKTYTSIIGELSDRPLIISPIFSIFNDFIGGGMLTTTRQLIEEGAKYSHCVASYDRSVDNGGTAIFNIGDHTAEICKTSTGIRLKQFKGLRNSDAPEDLRLMLNEKISTFNLRRDLQKYLLPSIVMKEALPYADHPF